MRCLRTFLSEMLLVFSALPHSRQNAAFGFVSSSSGRIAADVLQSRSTSTTTTHRHNINISAASSSLLSPSPSGRRASGGGVERRRWRRCHVRMDDEIARKGIKEELTTRDVYLATRFTKLSVSGHDLTPFTPSETQEAASHLPPTQKAALFGGAAGDERETTDPDHDHGDADEGEYRHWRDHNAKGLYACAVGGLPLFTSGWKLEPRAQDACPSFAEPCDDEHLLEERDSVNGGVTFVSCARSRVRVGRLVADSGSPSGKRYLISSAALEFHPLGKALPVRCQPENYWGSEGQYRAWVLE